ncbi:MAG: PQQ-binding-like beta-propeller repeat protein [Acidobacteria bacterium]|nr:PQQ-binding-like beta-propeller repeat protein [Acidobacteriota bacterium]
MSILTPSWWTKAAGLAVAVAVMATIAPVAGQQPPAKQPNGTANGEWRFWGGDAASTRYAPLEQINASNFEKLQVAWVWRGDNFGPTADNILRSTPTYIKGKLFTVAGERRTVAALDPVTGETLWTFREPHTKRWEDSMRKNYGKGVAYHETDGKGRVFMVSPAFMLHALDAETGRPIETFGKKGTVDMLENFGYPFDPYKGIPKDIGYITSSSAPIVVGNVIVVGPGHILAYDANTGKFLWKFNVIPQKGEEFNDTWKEDSWSYTGNVSAWAPLSADIERGIVYIGTDPGTNDFYGGHRKGQNLYSTSLIALDAKTGKRLWYYQLVHHDIWNYDIPHAPNLLDITVKGQKIPAIVVTTKQSWAYVFNRVTGEPVWPIEERPVPKSLVPGEESWPTQPHVTWPKPYEMQVVTHDELIDFTPDLRKKAIGILEEFQYGPLFLPPLNRGNALGKKAAIHCPGSNGGTNIPGGAAVDPETGILYVATQKACSAPNLVPGAEIDAVDPNQVGKTIMDWVSGPGVGPGNVDGLPLWKPPYSRITAIDLNTGEHLWWIPNGETPARVKNHPALKGLDIPNTGNGAHGNKLVTKTLLMYGAGRGAESKFYAVDKKTGKQLGVVDIPAPSNSTPMTFMHEGRQFIVIPIGGGNHPGSLVALSLPSGQKPTTMAQPGQ